MNNGVFPSYGLMHIEQLLQFTLPEYLEGKIKVVVTVGSKVCFYKNDYFGENPKRSE